MKKIKLYSLLIVLILLGELNLFAQNSSISMIGPSGNQVPGVEGVDFAIKIEVGNPVVVDNLIGVSFNIGWDDTNFVGAVTTTSGDFLGQNPLLIAQNYSDRIEVGISSSTGSKNGSGIVASCTLTVKQNGYATVNLILSNITALDENGDPIVLDPQNNPLSIQIGNPPENPSIVIVAPDTVTGLVGNIFPVDIMVGNPIQVNSLIGVSFNLEWDDTLYIEGTNSSTGPFLGVNPLSIFQNFINRIEVGVSSSTGDYSGSGVVVSCTLAVKANVSMPGRNILLNMTNITALDNNGDPITLVSQNNPHLVRLIPMNNFPQLDSIPDQQMHEEETLVIPIKGVDQDGNNITLTSLDLPHFGNLIDSLDGTGKLTFEPSVGDAGSYYDIKVIATDDGNPVKTDTVMFTLIVDIVDDVNMEFIPTEFILHQNFPNPFNPQTSFEVEIPEQSINDLRIYDITGREVQILLKNKILPTGRYKYQFSSKNLSSGVYIYVLTSSSTVSNKTFNSVKKMVLLK